MVLVNRIVCQDAQVDLLDQIRSNILTKDKIIFINYYASSFLLFVIAIFVFVFVELKLKFVFIFFKFKFLLIFLLIIVILTTLVFAIVLIVFKTIVL